MFDCDTGISSVLQYYYNADYGMHFDFPIFDKKMEPIIVVTFDLFASLVDKIIVAGLLQL